MWSVLLCSMEESVPLGPWLLLRLKDSKHVFRYLACFVDSLVFVLARSQLVLFGEGELVGGSEEPHEVEEFSRPVRAQFSLDDLQWPRRQQKIWELGPRPVASCTGGWSCWWLAQNKLLPPPGPCSLVPNYTCDLAPAVGQEQVPATATASERHCHPVKFLQVPEVVDQEVPEDQEVRPRRLPPPLHFAAFLLPLRPRPTRAPTPPWISSVSTSHRTAASKPPAP
ncbi:uncharacterized protein [Miscanthus floridulus]|uniref:uncharacterized protein isoform X4 n=1 Tax=Miscanthus floridulus TaxID=154761 RepID=UPI0034590DD9